MGRQCLAGQEHDRDVDALPVQLDQQVDAGNLRPVTMEDDDVGIAGGISCAGQRGDVPDGKALPGQLVGQESAADRAILDEAVLDEKDANGVWLADGGEKRGRRCLQGDDILFKSGHLKSLPLDSVSESQAGRESTPRRPASRQSPAVTRDDADSTCPRAKRATYRNVDHPSLPYRPGCLLSGTPAVRASPALPTAKLAERRHLARD